MGAEVHWTEETADAYAFELAASFIRFVEHEMDARGISQAGLAERIGITEGRVSQLMNNPGNLSLKTAVRIARALMCKVSLVGYNDGDPLNQFGPILPDVFVRCWQQCHRPRDFFDLENEMDQRPV